MKKRRRTRVNGVVPKCNKNDLNKAKPDPTVGKGETEACAAQSSSHQIGSWSQLRRGSQEPQEKGET